MSNETSTAEKDIEEILIDLMVEKVMSGIQASSMRGVQSSLSTAHECGPSRDAIEKITKHHDDLENVKLILSILPDCIPRDFEYTFIIVYLPKGIQEVRTQLERIPTPKISDYNLGDHKRYGMLAPHKYLTKTRGKKSNIIPQPWTMDIARSTIMNVMKIPHFGKHQEVNTCIKILFLCFYGGYLWLDRSIIINPVLFHRITGLSMQGPDPQEFYPGKAADRALAQNIKDTYGDVEKGTRGYKVAYIQNGAVCLAC
jgi:hypothetical protein